MIFYNYKGITQVAKSCKHKINLLKFIYKLEHPQTLHDALMFDKFKYIRSENQSCWLDNPAEVLNYPIIEDICVYLHISSLRNRFEVLESGSNSVPTYIVEQFYNLDKLKWNKLLKVTVDKIELEI